ncbi:histidine kinase [Pseudoflavitalea sp. X16]|uniref:sensor histidine kinase n=1 Tax=Paraflavitalea devenefica TaxID=2716334 RepID=UPI00141FDCCE|nr:histidine kinase [Paraflavitalea devenefica]NII26581.1 histidine kinase [Paraflavitalea devenefica]
MSKRPSIFTWDKYARIEWIFFICLCIIIPMGSDLEYTFNEDPSGFHRNYLQENIIRRIVWGFYSIIPYYLFYKLAIQQFLVKRKYGYFLLSVLLFIVSYELYKVYVMYWSISKLSFLPADMVEEASRWMKQKGLHFSIHYLLLQFLEMAALAYFIHYDKQQKQIRQLKQLQTEADLQYLQSQLHPHFFFNTLNNIYALALQQSQLTAPLVARLSEMMRYVLYEANKPKQPLTSEIQFMNSYIEVQSVRYNEKLSIRFDTQGITSQAMIEPLLLLPFIENAFKHGIEEELHAGYIETIIVLNEGELTLSVKNSKAMKAAEQTGRTGIGMENVRKRLALLYPSKHSLAIQETDHSYTVLLTIMLN